MIVTTIVAGEGTHDSQAMGTLGQLRQRAAEPNTWNRRLDLAGATAVVTGDVDLGVEGFDLRRATLQKQKDDGLVLE